MKVWKIFEWAIHWPTRARELRPNLLTLQVLLGLLVAGALIGALWKVPQWQIAGEINLKPKERIELENELRKTWAQIFGGFFVLIGIFLAWRRVVALERTVEVTQEGQITERYTRAIQQLGDQKNLEVRLGGIYALERIARDSPKDHWSIMEVLTAFVREKAPREENPAPDEEHAKRKPAADIQAILTVIGRRKRTFGKGEDSRLDLCRTDLQGADLDYANLSGANLDHANLSGANLGYANFEGAYFTHADLRGAFLGWTNLSEAYFNGADLGRARVDWTDLRGAYFIAANLREADLSGADLNGATLNETDLTRAHLIKTDLRGAHLSPDMLCHVRTLRGAKLDIKVIEVLKQKCPQLLTEAAED